MENIVGIAAGILTSVSMLPQLVKMIKEKKPTDISVVMLVTLLSGLGMWVWYGLLKSDLPIIITNCFSLLVNVLILILRQYFKNNGGRKSMTADHNYLHKNKYP